ncbi:MAG: hypothetical protein ACR2KT_03295 [Methylocella sp.]|nr:MAG: hypothetical protein DLM68_12395 [Hyphomicrobiales bacterium]
MLKPPKNIILDLDEIKGGTAGEGKELDAAHTKMFMFVLSSAVRGLNRMPERVGGPRALGREATVRLRGQAGRLRRGFKRFHPDLNDFLAGEFTVELNHAWVTVLGMIAETMIEAAENLSPGQT